jgi:hypothetical protein
MLEGSLTQATSAPCNLRRRINLPERPAAYVTGEMLIADGGYMIG